jgi:outer membrane receptor protein involved in Fe transport
LASTPRLASTSRCSGVTSTASTWNTRTRRARWPATIAIRSHIPTQSYFDLAVSTRIQGKATLRFGVDNIFDRDPPLVTSGPTGNACASVYCNSTYPGTYDSLGRYLYSSITLDF